MKIFRAFRGLSGTYNVRANERDRGAPRNIECLVQFLNNTQHKFIIDRRSKGQCLLDDVFKHLNLIETDFFGLKYLPQELDHCLQNNDSVPSILLTKTQSLNSYDHSPSPNASLSSSSTSNAPVNHQNTSADSPTIISTSTIAVSPNSVTNTITPTISPVGTVITNNIRCNNILSNNNSQHPQSNGENNKSTFVEERWLDPTKSIRKQYRTGPPFKFYFRVKFYVSDPCKLADDTTRNHLYLQLRQDILNNRLFVPPASAILLASYILQSEVGDYKRGLLEENYASKYRLLPIQTDDINKKVIEVHKQHKSLSSADAEYQFLEHAAKKLDCYGVEFYDAKDFNKTDVQVGVSSNGIVVFRDNEKASQFSWAKIIKIMFKKKIFSIQLRRDEGENCDNLLEYNLITNQACKSFWEECVAQHSFFRLHQPKTPPKKFFSFLNFGSKFQYSGKTEYQTMEESRKRSSHFSRTPSKRYARRTIPIGRPSWTVDQDNKTNDADSEQTNEHKQHSSEAEDISNRVRDVGDSSWMEPSSLPSSSAGPEQSVSPNLINGSVDPRSSAYRPKFLALKSIIYIDESKNISSSKKSQPLADSIKLIKKGLESKELITNFEKLPRKKEDEQLDESKLKENIDKNRYQDILPYDSTRVQLIDSMTGDYINASFVDMTVPSGVTNRYIATQGPLQSTCDDFWQMVWEQNCSLIIMVTPLIEAGRVKCHKYWPEEKEDFRYGQLLIRSLSEKSKTATINRTIQLLDVKVSLISVLTSQSYSNLRTLLFTNEVDSTER